MGTIEFVNTPLTVASSRLAATIKLLIVLNLIATAYLAAASFSNVGNAPLRMHTWVKSRALYAGLAVVSVALGVAILASASGSPGLAIGQYEFWLTDSLLLVASTLFISPRLSCWRIVGLTILGGIYVLSGSELIVKIVRWKDPSLTIAITFCFWVCAVIALGLWTNRHLHSVVSDSIRAQRRTAWLVPVFFVIPVAAPSLVGTGERFGLYVPGDDEALLGMIFCSLAAIVAGWFALLIKRTDQGFWELFHGAGEAITIVEPITWLIEENNSKAAELFGDLLSKHREHSLADLVKIALPHASSSVRSLTEVRPGEVVEIRFSNQCGYECWGELHMRNVMFRGRNRSMVYIRDVSRRKTLEQEHAMALRVRALGEWAGGTAHDFNNLLAGMIMCSDLLTGRLVGDPESQVLVEQIKKAARSAEQLTRRILTYSRRRTRSSKKTDVNELIPSVVNLLKHTLAPTVSVHMDLDQQIGEINVDLVEMEEVLINLAFNARDAMPEGGSLTFETRSIDWPTKDFTVPVNFPVGSYVLLSVRDTGIGMDEATAARACEPFFTTKSERHGTGLGLWTVHNLVTQNAGYMGIESIVGKGTNVRIFIPASDNTAKSPAGISTSATAA